jgi:hypothetical protein
VQPPLFVANACCSLLVRQGAYGASLLEVINYVEHYGLKREKLPNGKYVRTAPEHSWNSNHVVTNLFLYQLQRHSDHHAHPSRSFQALRHFENAPQLPGGYASMLLPAYIPSLWYKIMDERVIQHYKGDLSKINMDPERTSGLKFSIQHFIGVAVMAALFLPECLSKIISFYQLLLSYLKWVLILPSCL